MSSENVTEIDLNLRIGVAINRLRQMKSIKQSDLAEQANMTQPHLSMIERGVANKRMSLNTLRRLALALGLSGLGELITFAEEERDLKKDITNAEALFEKLSLI